MSNKLSEETLDAIGTMADYAKGEVLVLVYSNDLREMVREIKEYREFRQKHPLGKYVQVQPFTREDLIRKTTCNPSDINQLTDADLMRIAGTIEVHFNTDALWDEADYWIQKILQEKERGSHD